MWHACIYIVQFVFQFCMTRPMCQSRAPRQEGFLSQSGEHMGREPLTNVWMLPLMTPSMDLSRAKKVKGWPSPNSKTALDETFSTLYASPPVWCVAWRQRKSSYMHAKKLAGTIAGQGPILHEETYNNCTCFLET